MRKSDKKKNIAKVNLLAEQRYLESKGLIKENIFGYGDLIPEIAAELGISEEEFERYAEASYAEYDEIEKIYMSNSLTKDEALNIIKDLIKFPDELGENDYEDQAITIAKQVGGYQDGEDLSALAAELEKESGKTNEEERPPMPRPTTKYQYNTMVGTVLYDYFFKGKQNANDAEFLEGYLKALQMEVQQTNAMINNLKSGQSNITGVEVERPGVASHNR